MRSRRFVAAVLVIGAVTLIGGMAASQAQREAEVEAFYRDAIEELLASPSGRAFLDAYIALRRDYLYATDREALLAGATEGLIEALADPYTRYLSAEEAAAGREVDGIGDVEASQLGDLGLIRIRNFDGEMTGARVSDYLDGLVAAGVRGIVLDLRANPGGSILQGLQVLDRFLDEGELGYRRVRGVSVPIAYANPRSVALPLVVIVDEDTASTAEIVAGTLQAYGRAPLVGARTSGKGVGQTAVPLSDGAELRLVSFEWLLPGLRSVDGTGLTPDVLVLEKAHDPESPTALTMAAILDTDLDPPLRAAIELLREELADDLEARGPIPVPRVGVEPVMVPVPEDQAEPRDAPADD